MIRILNAYTFEIDDAETAVKEILEQLDLNSLLANTAGIMTCHTDFLEAGTAKAIAGALPFKIIGCSTAANALPEEMGEIMLTLTVLTSEDVVFSAGFSESIVQDQDSPLSAAYRRACEALPGPPALMLVYAPFIRDLGGEAVLDSLNRVTGGLPIFGTISIDNTADFSKTQTIIDGEGSQEKVVFLLFHGNIQPSFTVASISGDKVQKQRGIITKSKGNLLMEVNDLPLLAYLKNVGFLKELGAWEVVSFPYIVDYNDGTEPVPRSIYLITPEGYAACGGYMPEGATIAIGDLDYSEVIRTASVITQNVLSRSGSSCVLMYSCLTRYLVLGADTTAEMKQVRAVMGNAVPYQFCYSGGEICPVYNEQGKLVNRFHNCSFIACSL